MNVFLLRMRFYFQALKTRFDNEDAGLHGLLFFLAVCIWIAAFAGYLILGRS